MHAHSLLPKIDELYALCLTHSPHVVYVVESWIWGQTGPLEPSLVSDNHNFVMAKLDRALNPNPKLL